MKTIAVICNSRYTWNCFVGTLKLKLSKENKPYETIAGAIIDIHKNIKYICVPNCANGIQKLRGYILSDYITMGVIVDNDLHDYIMSHMRCD